MHHRPLLQAYIVGALVSSPSSSLREEREEKFAFNVPSATPAFTMMLCHQRQQCTLLSACLALLLCCCTVKATGSHGQLAPPLYSTKGSSTSQPLLKSQAVVSAAPFVLLQRTAPLKHTLKLSTHTNSTTVRLAAVNPRKGVLHKAALRSSGDVATIRIRVPINNEYVGVGVFAADLEPHANVDLSLEFKGEVITESSNPAGIDELVEALDGLMPGDYIVRIKGSAIPRALTAHVYVWVINARRAQSKEKEAAADELAVQITPNPVQLTASPGCCPVELSIRGISNIEMADTRCACDDPVVVVLGPGASDSGSSRQCLVALKHTWRPGSYARASCRHAAQAILANKPAGLQSHLCAEGGVSAGGKEHHGCEWCCYTSAHL